MKTIVITGVSTGIGHATAKLLVENKFRVFGSVRKQADAKRLSKELGPTFTPLLFDATDEDAVAKAAKHVEKELKGQPLFGLINNAGIAIGGPLIHTELDDFRKQVEVNIIGTFIVTQAFAPLLVSKKGKSGRIINIGSTAGTTSSPFFGAYSMTKFAMEAFTDSLRRELMLYGVDVIVVRPGPIQTPIWKKGEKYYSLFNDTDFSLPISKFSKLVTKTVKTALLPEPVAKVILKALTHSRPKTSYVVTANKFFSWVIPKRLPKRVIDRFFAKMLGLKKK